MIMNILYTTDSIRDAGSLCNLRHTINAAQVATNIRKCFYAVENFLDKVTEALLKVAYDYMHAQRAPGKFYGKSRNIGCDWIDNLFL